MWAGTIWMNTAYIQQRNQLLKKVWAGFIEPVRIY
jgi:hypothetical protein